MARDHIVHATNAIMPNCHAMVCLVSHRCSGWAIVVLALTMLALGLRMGGSLGHHLAAEATPILTVAALLWCGAAAGILHW